MYAKGKGIPQNFIQVYAWFSLAYGEKSPKEFEAVKKELTATQLKQAKKLAGELQQSIDQNVTLENG